MSDEFQSGGNVSSYVRPIQAGSVKKGSFAMLKGRPCKVVDISTSKTGKHGHAKASIVGIDIFTGKKYDGNFPTSHNMEEPIVTRTQYVIIHWEDDVLHLLDSSGAVRMDLTWPVGRDDKVLEEWKKQLAEGNTPTVTVLSSCGEDKVIGPNDK
uniref:Eukaryotic translation initiation factor 5A n=1 Tax=Dermatophagoides pteronyssinus TaxID=6956 RepID=A0A6P6YBL9_DERPT|nr:eukaryotic translation initiation factor 5A-like [Dermatophagoides pteronyssinus]